MEHRGIIFDWGGVLMRTMDYQPRLGWDAILGVPSGTVEKEVLGSEAWNQAQRGEISLENYWRTIASSLQLGPKQLANLRREFYSGDRLDKSLIILIQQFREAGLLIGLLSNNTSDLSDTVHDLEIHDIFDAQIISANIGIMKPDPQAYYAILRKLELEPHQTIFIDDFIENVEGAVAVGMSAIHFSPDIDLKADIQQWLGTPA